MDAFVLLLEYRQNNAFLIRLNRFGHGFTDGPADVKSVLDRVAKLQQTINTLNLLEHL